MSARRALVDCAVLSLQDAVVFYPYCKCCFSRVEGEHHDPTRFRCFKCGYSCLREQLDYRYRLSLQVTRDRSIFGVTVFGTCLNPFFGIHAGGLQRLVDTVDGSVGSLTRSKLLVKAVEDCFIGRHFIFGIKVAGTKSDLSSGRPVANGSNNRETAQFTASQMILPKAMERTGCTVLSYYRVLLRQAEEHELESTDTNKSSGLPIKTLLLIPLHSPSFSNSSLSASGLLSQSLQSSQHQDCTLSPTPPWQQSLGLVTSSAEQDEGCSTQEGGDKSFRPTNYSKTPHRHQLRSCLRNPKFTEETTPSPPISYNDLSFSTYPDLSTEKSNVNTSTPDRWSSSPQSMKKGSLLSCNTQLTKTFLSSSFAWDDLPFSESLTEFLYEKENVAQTNAHHNIQNVAENASQDMKQDKQIKVSQSRLFEDITNTLAHNDGGGIRDLSDSVLINSKKHVESSTESSIGASKVNQHDVIVRSLSFDNEEDQLEGDAYNCSADLFSSSLTFDMNTTTLNTCKEAVRMDAESSTLPSNSDKQKLRIEQADVSYMIQHKLKNNNCFNLDTFNSPAPQDLDFVPPSQSTPNVKLASFSQLPASTRFSLMSGKFGSDLDTDLCAYHGYRSKLGSENNGKITSELKLNKCRANQLPPCAFKRNSTKGNMRTSAFSRRSHRFTPGKRFWKAVHCRRVEGEAPHLGLNERISHKSDSSVSDVTLCDNGDNEVPPTPAAKSQMSMRLRKGPLSDDSTSNVDSSCEDPKGNVDIGKSISETWTSNNEVISGGIFEEPNDCLVDDENQACDWSRDLFSDCL